MATNADYKRLGAWAVMLNPDQNINRRTRHRTVPMQVLSLGLSRTGTLSMHEALEILGYPTYHYSNIFSNVRDADIWMDAFNAKFNGKGNLDYKQAFDQVLGDCSAITDAPSVLFWKELTEAYPDAKIVLVERDEDKWVPSIGGLIDGVFNPVATYVLRFTDPLWFGRIINCGRGWIEAFTGSTNPTQAKKNAVAAYKKHYADIRAAIPKEKILEFQLRGGWEPLCKFLEKDVPNMPFPHRNEAATLENSFGAAIGKAFKNSFMNLAVVLGVGAVVWAVAWQYTA